MPSSLPPVEMRRQHSGPSPSELYAIAMFPSIRGHNFVKLVETEYYDNMSVPRRVINGTLWSGAETRQPRLPQDKDKDPEWDQAYLLDAHGLISDGWYI